jgi:hypothetical protein
MNDNYADKYDRLKSINVIFSNLCTGFFPSKKDINFNFYNFKICLLLMHYSYKKVSVSFDNKKKGGIERKT